MTEKIALNMNAEGFKVTKTLFDIAWEILSENQKERLMIANLELLNVDDMEKCFGELSGQYSVLTERTKRRNIKLDNTENNRKLVEYFVRRHIVGGANRTLFSVDLPPRLCRTGT